MQLPRRRFLHLAVGAAGFPVVPRIARAQSYPVRRVRIIIGYGAGGASDILARLMGQRLTERLGQPFIIENRPGASTNIATEEVVKAAPDGYTLLLISSAAATNVALYAKLNFNFIRDIVPVAGIARSPFVMLVNPSFPAKTVPEFIAYAKANPGKINMASAGAADVTRIAGELFMRMTGIVMQHVPYTSDGPAINDLVSGNVDVYFGTLLSSLQHIKAGGLRALAVTPTTRSDVLPGIPTVSEFVPGFEAIGWNGIGAPKNTPPEIVDTLNREINEALADPKFKARIFDLGGEPMPMPPAAFGELIVEYTKKWGDVIRAANIKAE